MILLVHMLFGAAIGSLVRYPALAIFLALLGHYFLDLFPHVEYSIDNIRSKNWERALPDFAKICLDALLAFLVIWFVSKNTPIIYLCALVAALPDAATVVTYVFPKFLWRHNIFHTKHIHYLTKQKKFPIFWRILTQALAVLASVFLLRF